MKYAIRLSYLPPCILYLDVDLAPDAVVAELCYWSKGVGPFQFVHNIVAYFMGVSDGIRLVEDGKSAASTDPKDSDYLMLKTDHGWVCTRLMDAEDRRLLGR